MSEWSENKKWNPFNSYKLLSQVYRWDLIKEGKELPQPATISVDPINVCNFNCSHCNANELLRNKSSMMSKKTLFKIANTLASWKGSPEWNEVGVGSICIGGGGESLLNPHVGSFINKCVELGIEVGIVTNGSMIDKFIPELAKCSWVGVSIDAGTKETFKEQKGIDLFDRVITNIKSLVDYSKEHNTKLVNSGVSYKYLLNKFNIGEIYKAAKIAKSIGCKNLHIRPVGIPWEKEGSDFDKELCNFSREDIKEFEEQVRQARKLEDENFGVYGVTHKFTSGLRPKHTFKTCHAVFMNGVFMPGKDENCIDFGLCCDRRYDDSLLLVENGQPKDVVSVWGNKKHWDIFKKLKISECPRCTFSPHNSIFEEVIQKDKMTYKFI